jgi:uncharacterized protein YggU (UPF0235/DUF167 family)
MMTGRVCAHRQMAFDERDERGKGTERRFGPLFPHTMADDLFELLSPAPKDEATPATIAIRVHVRPGPGRSAILGRPGDALAVRVAPPASSPAANSACQSLLAELFGVDDAKVAVISGETGAEKRFSVADVLVPEVRQLITHAVEDAGRGPSRAGRDGRPGR